VVSGVTGSIERTRRATTSSWSGPGLRSIRGDEEESTSSATTRDGAEAVEAGGQGPARVGLRDITVCPE